MATNDGGPAFPIPMVPYNDGFTDVLHGGMTIRDYFAAKAMVSLLRGDFRKFTEVAADAYMVADAMLAAREVQP